MRRLLSKLRVFEKPEIAFLLVATIAGLLFAFLTPPTQVGDETTHFYRAYQLSDGHIWSQKIDKGYGAQLPREVNQVTVKLFDNIPSNYDKNFDYSQLPSLLKQKIDNNDRIPVHLEGATVYSPTGYIPQVVAIVIAKVVWPSVVFMYYLGRVLNLVAWIALVYFAIRLWPFNKWVLFALALTPMAVSQAASLSVDATMNGLAFLVISSSFYIAKQKTKVPRKYLLLWGTGALTLSLCKPIFLSFCLLSLLWGNNQFRNMKLKWMYASSLAAVLLFITAAWTLSVKKYTEGIQLYYFSGRNIDEVGQVKDIIANPLHVILVFFNTYFSAFGDFIYKTFIGRLGWWDIDLPIWLILLTYILILSAVLIRGPRELAPNKRERAYALVSFAIAFTTANAILYLTITEIGSNTIFGIQGRYFIALSPLLAVCAAGLIVVPDWKRRAAILFPISYMFILLTSLAVMVNRFI